MTVQLAVVPEKRSTRIVVATTVRKNPATLRFYLDALEWQDLPPNSQLIPIFVDDNIDAESSQMLREFANGRGAVLQGAPAPVKDFDDQNPETHAWSPSAMLRVGANKDAILREAQHAVNADYVWFCDADLICDRTTLRSLLACDTDIATAVYWTRWSAQGTETRKVHAAPQVWLAHPYTLSHAGMPEHEFRDRLARRQLTKVAGYGACTLLNRRALEAGVSFAPVAGVSMEGLMAGEDRHFCIRAQRLHLNAVADPWPDIFHIYHPSDLAKAPRYAMQLNRASQDVAFGSLVNLTIQPIEPIPWAGGGYTAVPPQYVRGRLGALALMPELEEAIYDLAVGETRIVPVHFPISYPVPFYQGKRRLIRVTLNDTKPFGFAPVLDEEMLIGTRSGAAVRTVDLNTRQLEGMREMVNA